MALGAHKKGMITCCDLCVRKKRAKLQDILLCHVNEVVLHDGVVPRESGPPVGQKIDQRVSKNTAIKGAIFVKAYL